MRGMYIVIAQVFALTTGPSAFGQKSPDEIDLECAKQVNHRLGPLVKWAVPCKHGNYSLSNHGSKESELEAPLANKLTLEDRTDACLL